MSLAIEGAQLLLLGICTVAVLYGELSAGRYRKRALPLYGNRLDTDLAIWARLAGRNAVVAPLGHNEQPGGHQDHEDFSHSASFEQVSDR